jgi:hypothetical protein
LVVSLATFREKLKMYSRDVPGPIRRMPYLHPLAKSAAEATVLKNLARNWKMIANQMALYEAILKDQK